MRKVIKTVLAVSFAAILVLSPIILYVCCVVGRNGELFNSD